MAKITVLDQNTINQIAAGEVIERPASVVKELLENAIDAKATAITVEIKDGGTSLIRITDNGCGISKDEIRLAFLPHATSKIHNLEDLITVSSLGFRGEALPSIASVAQVEVISKVTDCVTGIRYQVAGGLESGMEEVGAPEGTTFLVRNLFYNVPVRRKFLKNPAAEASHVSEIVERIALSHPEISIRFINNNQNKLHTAGNYNIKDIIYTVYGREIAANLLKTEIETDIIKISGYVGKPMIARGNRNYENYFINGRYVKSGLIYKAIEEAFSSFMMQHKYPFTVLYFEIKPELMDVNVHPTKMELRFRESEKIYKTIIMAIKEALAQKELIVEVNLLDKKEKNLDLPSSSNTIREEPRYHRDEGNQILKKAAAVPNLNSLIASEADRQPIQKLVRQSSLQKEQIHLFDEKLLAKESKAEHRIIGQLFDTYWLVQFKEQLFIIDQHAAHEKVLYEKTMKSMEKREYTSQMVSPPIILTLSMREETLLKEYQDYFTEIGFEIEYFGGKEYSVSAVPDNLFSIAKKDLLLELIDGLSEGMGKQASSMIQDKIASLSCKAAVKGNQKLSYREAEQLIDQLMELENPYACPHGRPTIITMSKYELEKKFKRIL